ncbi:MAG: hypothetical protein WAT31_01905, partial [Candidatus Saccharimonas aalborgensis]
MPVTIFRALSRSLLGALFVGVFVVSGIIGVAPQTAHAATGINQQMNFQGRLLNAQGAVVPDGYYNIQFKIYQDGTGTTAGNPGGTLKWTEDWLNTAGNGVQVKNGFMSVQLGTINPFGSQVDWNQDTLWLSVNIGTTNTTCTPFSSCGGDGEMVPMKRLASVAYAMNAGSLGGLTASGFIQNTTVPQSANIAVQSASASSVGAMVQGASSQSVDLFRLQDSNGNVNAAFNNNGDQLTLGRISTTGTVTQGKLVFNDGTLDGYGLTIQSGTQTGNYTLTLPSLAGNATVCTSNSTATSACTNFIQNQTTLQAASNFHISGTGQADTAIITPAIRPTSDSTTALKVQNAAGTTDIMTIDSTNNRVGIALANGETASYDLSFGGGTDRIIGVNTNTSTGVGRSLTLQGGGGNGTNQAGGAVNIIGGAPTGSGVRGAVNLQTTVNGDVNIGNAGSAANTVTLTAGATNGIKLVSDKIMVGNATTTTTIQKTTQTTAGQAGQQLTIQGATSGTTGVGGAVLIQGGNSATGTTGGNLTLAGGTGTTSNGLVILNTSAFQTIANDANCFPSGTESTSSSGCTVAQTSVNNYASVIVGFTQDGQTATLPDPSIATAGRVVYVTASNLTKDFTLSVNGGGQGNQIAMRKNTTATMIWNGA